MTPARGASMCFFNGKNRGFTLVQLQIAMAVIGILTSIAIPGYLR